MADKMSNIGGLFKESRSRIVILITAFILISTVLMGIFLFKKGVKGPAAEAQLLGTPHAIKSVPGGFEKEVSPQYAKLIEQQNVQKAQQALQQGTSAVPTIIRAEELGGEIAPGGGLGFGALSRGEREGGVQKLLEPEEEKAIGVVCADGTVRDAQGNIVGRAGAVAPGTVVYDDQGNVIGVVGADGIVRDAKGNIIGRVGADGLVRDPSGKIIGKASTVAPGTLIYDAQGHVIGTLGADGLVRDANGNVIGRMGADGLVRDANGNIIGKAGCAAPGAAVHDVSGKLLGSVGKDGRVVASNGTVVGTVGPDCNVRDAKGNIIGRAGAVPPGTAVCDSQSRSIGHVGADGLVRDTKGNIVGTVGPDGVVRDAKGNIMGRSCAVASGTLVYDDKCRVVGSVNADGSVRDGQNNVLGTVGSDGIVRSAQGKVLGKTSPITPGRLVYDGEEGVIGIVGADGSVRDISGTVIGKVDCKDGKVRDLNGNVIGKPGNVSAGAFIYKDECTVVGTVGNDGAAYDLKGSKIGKVGSDGVAKDNNGQTIGKVGVTSPGQMIGDAQGRIIGKVGADGKVRDAKGKVLGKVCADGGARDAKGNLIGKVNGAKIDITPGSAVYDAQGKPIGVVQQGGTVLPVTKAPEVPQPAAPTAPALPVPPVSALPSIGAPRSDLQALLARQQSEQFSAQQRDQMKQQIESAMRAQASQLFTSWTPPKQDFVIGMIDTGAGAKSAAGAAGGAGAGGAGGQQAPLIKAGTILFAVLDTGINTDEPGPIMATVVEGQYKGARILGMVTRLQDKAVLNFATFNLPAYSSSIQINAVAIDSNTARTALASNVDNHYLLRYGTLFASSFLQGYGQAVTQAGATITTNGFNTVTGYPPLSGKDKIVIALGSVGQQWGAQLAPIFSTPPTVTVNSGTGVGVLFLADVTRPPS